MDWLRGLCRSSAAAAAKADAATAPSRTPLSSEGDGARMGGGGDSDDVDACSLASTFREELPLFMRDAEVLKLINFLVDEEEPALELDPLLELAAPRVVAWSPDGLFLAIVDPVEGLMIVEIRNVTNAKKHSVCRSATNTQQLQWSPLSTRLVTQSPKGEDNIENVQVWKRTRTQETFVCEASFMNARFEKGRCLFQWSEDERFCCMMSERGELQLLDATDLSKSALAVLSFPRFAEAFRLAPSRGGEAVLAAFLADSRDSLQRVVAPAEVIIVSSSDGFIQDTNRASIFVKFGQQADLMWSPSGTALLAHCQTDVDDSGKSYYGGSKLVLCSNDAKYSLDLTEEADSVVQAVSWNPSCDQFVLVQGFQPAKVTCWVWDSGKRECSIVATLLEKAHRNTIRWNHFGSMVCIAGFGNLAGEIDFFGYIGKGLERISSCEASCTVSADWAPDGRHLLTAVLAPRMRVDNGIIIFSALTGAKVASKPCGELFEASWRPESPQSERFLNVTAAELGDALRGAVGRRSRGAGGSGDAAAKKRQAYRPPSARAAGSDSLVAQMMRGEVDGASSIEARKQASAQEIHTSAPRRGTPLEEPRRTAPPTHSHGDKVPCPENGWEYKDPKGRTHGPFTLEQMQKWHTTGAFKPQLPMRCHPDDPFIPLAELFPHPMVPFHRAPRRPK
eukprot:TRINITY_DN4109_c1_g2_i1.p1 TRINITY_DN4109_c1_g2~~TRINITY_DN4109_c1_g2_i1.p1  ORF type:complete len:718 (+),score=107.98 TRINITY_DN4109_c1_g2_i1:125-2155(+)